MAHSSILGWVWINPMKTSSRCRPYWPLAVILLLRLSLAPAVAAPPIRCVHQTTVVRDGKATTHLILTTTKPGEVQTPKNTAEVVFSGRIRPPQSYGRETEQLLANSDKSLVAVNFMPDDPEKYDQYGSCVFLSTQRQGLVPITDFDERVCRLLSAKLVRHLDGTISHPTILVSRGLSVCAVGRSGVNVQMGGYEPTFGFLEIGISEDKRLTLLSYEEEGE